MELGIDIMISPRTYITGMVTAGMLGVIIGILLTALNFMK